MTTKTPIQSPKASIVISVVICLLHVWLFNVAYEFADVFAGFGAKLPLFTQLFLPGSFIYYLLPAAAIIALVAQYLQFRSARLAFLIVSVASGLFLPAFIIAMYLPIFQLGAAVTTQ